MTTQLPVIDVRNLTISATLRDGTRVTVVDDVTFQIGSGGSLGLVGESGSGKTMTSLAIIGLLPTNVRVDAGQILLDGEDLLTKSKREMEQLRGRRIAMITQDPLTALDPSFTIRSQLAEPLSRHRGLSGQQLDAAITSSLEDVELASSAERQRQYPHQLSGGMRQRVTSAIALAGTPRLLIADEPTTALDVTTQARYLGLLRRLQEENDFALLLVAHDLMVIRHTCEHAVVMYAGHVVEAGPVDGVFSGPDHPYTKALLRAIPTIGQTVQLEAIEGQAPDPRDMPSGCRFAPRCPNAREVCRQDVPSLSGRGPGRSSRCHGTEPGGWIAT